MITVSVPLFDEFRKYEFLGTVKIKIKNKPDYKDREKITAFLPGICAGACGPEPLKTLIEEGRMEVRSFYDARQNTKKLKGYYVTAL